MVSTDVAAQVSASPGESHDDQREDLTVGLWLIIAMKAVTALLLWGGFALLLIAGREDPRNFFSIVVFRTFRGNPPALVIHFLTNNLQFISAAVIIRVALATAVYAVVESVEAIGLYLREWWAEWLVILVTVSFIPVEVYEILDRPNPFKVATLIANVIVLWYLLKRVLDKRAEHHRAILPQS
jgi:uncharacterized membrane protein (DUF2068 family)